MAVAANSKAFHDQHWRILPKVFLALTFTSLFGLAVFNGVFFYSTWAEFGRSSLSSLLIAIPASIAFYVYHKYRFDFINLIISVIALLGAYCFLASLLIRGASLLIRGVEEGVLLGLIGFTFTVMAINWLVKRYKREYPIVRNSIGRFQYYGWLPLLIAVVTIRCLVIFFLSV